VRERTSSCNAQIYALVCVRKRDRESVCGEERIFGAKSGEKKAVQVLSDTLTTKNGFFGPLDALLGILRTKTMSIKPHTSIMSYYLYKYTFTHKRRAIYTHSSLCVCVSTASSHHRQCREKIDGRSAASFLGIFSHFLHLKLSLI